MLLHIDSIDPHRVRAEVRVDDRLHHEAAPRSYQAPSKIVTGGVAQGEDDLVILAVLQALGPVWCAQAEFLELGAVAYGLEVLALER